VLSDTPVTSLNVRAYNHPLGECGVLWMGAPALAKAHRRGFSKSLYGAPMLLPTDDTALRRDLIRRGTFQRGDYALGDALEPRLGAEASFPLRGLSLQARAGLHSQAPGALAYRGLNTAEAAAFPGDDRRLLVSVGSSVVTRSLRLDVASMFSGDAVRISVGGAIRF
jgi:hypothetical protein